jgi:hypothetical protein
MFYNIFFSFFGDADYYFLLVERIIFFGGNDISFGSFYGNFFRFFLFSSITCKCYNKIIREKETNYI